MRRLSERLRDESGNAVVIALLLAAVLVGFSALMAASGLAQTRAVAFDSEWEIALHAAEAATELGLYEVDADSDFDTGHLAEDLDGIDAIVAAADGRPAHNANPVPGGEFVVVKPADDDVVYGVGYAPSRDATDRRVRVVALRYDLGGNSWPLPNAAITANHDITLSGGSSTSSGPAEHQGHVIANGDADLSGSETLVDGDAIVVGTVEGHSSVSGTVSEGASAYVFPSDAEIEAWRAELIADAQSEDRVFYSNVKFKNTTITAPMYVDGELTLQGDVTILGSGVIYATERIKLTGGAIVEAGDVTLVSGELVEMSGGSEYRLSSPAADGGLVSFGVDEKAMKLTGGSSGSTQGIAYTPYGGIEMSGGATYYGALVAGGESDLGDVKLSGGSDVFRPIDMSDSDFFDGLGSGSETIVVFRYEL